MRSPSSRATHEKHTGSDDKVATLNHNKTFAKSKVLFIRVYAFTNIAYSLISQNIPILFYCDYSVA